MGPALLGQKMTLTSKSELQVAFDLLDEQRRGALELPQAVRWLRCAGWCLPEQELATMLAEHARQRARRGAEELFGFKQLLDVLEKNRGRAPVRTAVSGREKQVRRSVSGGSGLI